MENSKPGQETSKAAAELLPNPTLEPCWTCRQREFCEVTHSSNPHPGKMYRCVNCKAIYPDYALSRPSATPAAVEADVERPLERAVRDLRNNYAALVKRPDREGKKWFSAFVSRLDRILARTTPHPDTERTATLEREIAALREALDYAILVLGKQEPGDVRAVSDEFVAMAVLSDISIHTVQAIEDSLEILRRARTTLGDQ